MHCFQFVPVWIDHEGCIVCLTVVGSRTRAPAITPARSRSRGVKLIDRRRARCGERKVEPRPCGERHTRFRFKEKCQPLVPLWVRGPISNSVFAAPYTHESKRCERSIVERLRSVEIANTERDVAEHVVSITAAPRQT
jgi:hypothetical protein